LGINIVAVFAARRKGRCWKVAVFGGTKARSQNVNFCGRKPYQKMDGSEVGWRRKPNVAIFT
jgi:hypothetical protein